MEETRKKIAGAGAWSLVLGILTLLYGLTVGILGIVNGGRLLGQSRKLRS
jgi:hypothetical protein